jgi:multidrug efflux system membrane fusion protein
LWPGQYVDARVLVRTERDALTSPDGAVQLGPAGPFTYVVKRDSTVEVRPLHVAESANGLTIITAGLAPGERVVTSNQYRLQPGSHVHDSAIASSDEAASARVAPARAAPAAVAPTAVVPTGAAGRHTAS